MLNSKFKGKILITVFIFLAVFCFWNAFLVDEVSADWCVGYCYNGPTNSDSGGCGTPCYEGQPWTKYVYVIVIDPLRCTVEITHEPVCSTGDKCVSGETGLRCGYCDCTYGSSLYKSCCIGSTGINCISYDYYQDPYYPREGECPAGSDTILDSSCPVNCGSCQYESGGVCYNYCSGTSTSCGCTSCANCNSSDGWYNDGSTYYCCEGTQKCTCQDQEYRDYYCSGTSCTYSVTDNQTLKWSCSPDITCGGCDDDCSSGAKRCSGDWVQKCQDCDDDPCVEWCNYEYCSYGCSGSTCNSASGCYYDSSGCAIWYPGQYPYYNTICGTPYCVGSCNCCCLGTYPWCCSDPSAYPPTNCSCGEAPYCCLSATNRVLCHDQYGNGPYCYSAGALCTSCNGNLIVAPSVTTNDAASIEETSVQLQGNITHTGNASPDQRILEWGTSSYSYSWNHNTGSGGTGTFSYTPTNLNPGTKYYFRAKTHNTSGWGYGIEKSFTTKTEAPTNLHDSAVTKNSITLEWIKGNGAEKTMVRYKTNAYPSSTSDGSQAYFGSASSYTKTSLSSGQIYYFRAWSYKSGAPGSGYSDSCSQDMAYTKPGDPSGLNAVVQGQTQIDINWTKGAGGDKTMIRRKENSYPTSTSDGAQVYFNTGTSTSDTILGCGIHYYYRAWAYDSDSGFYSDSYTQTNATTDVCMVIPTVTIQAASSIEEQNASMNGNIASAGGENCDTRGFVYAVASKSVPGNVAPASSGYSNYTIDSGNWGTGYWTTPAVTLVPGGGTKYYIRAYAHNSAGYDYSNTELSFTSKPNPPTSPTSSNVEATTAHIGWTAPVNGSVDGYYCRYKTGSYPTSYTNGSAGSVSGAGSDLTGLSAGTTYYYRIWSHKTGSPNTGGVCDFPIEGTFLTKPAAPTNVQATDGAHTDKVVISWTASSGTVTGYKVYRDSGYIGSIASSPYNDSGASAPSITPGSAIASDGSSTAYVSLSLSGTSVNNGTTYTYKVRAYNTTGDSGDSNTNTGYRGHGTLTYQWQRSTGDSDASYSNISGATSSTYNDTGAPADGGGRYYRCIENANGVVQQVSSSDRGYRIPANQAPNAVISCDDSVCGPGSDCESGNWVAYSNCVYIINNDSTDPDSTNPPDNDNDIDQSIWYTKVQGQPDGSYVKRDECSGKCIFTPTNYLGAGDYVIKLYVEDQAGKSGTAFHDLTVKQEAAAGFVCSLGEEGPWVDCDEDVSGFKPAVGETVYFNDSSGIADNYSIASGTPGENSIDFREWEKKQEEFFISFDSGNSPVTSTTLTEIPTIIKLTITDSIGRSAWVEKSISASYPLPKWKETAP